MGEAGVGETGARQTLSLGALGGWGEGKAGARQRFAGRGVGGGELRSAQLAFAALRLAHGLSPYEKRQK